MNDLIFIELKEFPNYFACSDGYIYSKNYLYKSNATVPRKMKYKITIQTRYARICLPKESKKVARSVHILICEAFHGERPRGMECSHLDDDKYNNKPENLKWESHSVNMNRGFKNDKCGFGYKFFNASLTKEQFEDVKILLSKGVKHIDIAKKYNCDRSTITKINTGDRYTRC